MIGGPACQGRFDEMPAARTVCGYGADVRSVGVDGVQTTTRGMRCDGHRDRSPRRGLLDVPCLVVELSAETVNVQGCATC